MPDQKYRPLRSEEDGEVSPQRDFSTVTRNCGLNIRHLTINTVIFTVGLFVGLFLNNLHPRCADDQLAQYSMVPCKYTVPA
jgi:hypothetical protein